MPNRNIITTTSKTKFSTDIVRNYLQDIVRVPLLTHEEEILYSKQVQQMIILYKQKETLTKQLNHEPSQKELAKYVQLSEIKVKEIFQHGIQAKQKMMAANLRLVVSIAQKYQGRNVEFMDLIQEGSLGLERGVEKFDPTRGYKFSTYAYWWISQGMTRAISQQSRTIRLPIHLTEKLNKLKKVQRELSQKLKRSPSMSEIAEKMKLNPAQIRELLMISRQPVSFDKQVGDNEDTELQEFLTEVPEASPEIQVTQNLMRQDIYLSLRELTPQQQQVLILHYGLEDNCELTLTQVAQQLNISERRVRYLEKQALSYLRRCHTNLQEYIFS
ncbi:RpoD/SigA family RNA polymerase sigma factor [Anabaena sp. WFMT]|uniref:RpoD/SigA family RNA polymerase sigma factor n=1 Tax=Anabaena lutea FACHB-196 TaxID=2692881 RepID=A0ABR8FGJ5_9NOST|nr:RpoD/SigA family RNA polymerase sigma factor [Anabaena lutea]MBD2568733.1 RpoD/SigA family RNA polymerase sigma factor [Anabaena lutea FACHB-196]